MAAKNREFLWRPNDNSASTLLKYDLEAEHWTRAFNSAQSKYKPYDPGPDSAFIGSVVGSIFSLIYLIVTSIVKLFEWIFADNNKSRQVNGRFSNPQKQARAQAIRRVLINRPGIFKTSRNKLFKKAALIVVMKQHVSMSSLMYELKIDFETVSKLIDGLYEAGIISGINSNNRRRVLIGDKESLNLLYKMETQYSTL